MILLQFKPKIALSEQKNCNKFCNFLIKYKLNIFYEKSNKVKHIYKEFREEKDLVSYLVDKEKLKIIDVARMYEVSGFLKKGGRMYYLFED